MLSPCHSLSWLHWAWKADVISFSEKSSIFFDTFDCVVWLLHKIFFAPCRESWPWSARAPSSPFPWSSSGHAACDGKCDQCICVICRFLLDLSPSPFTFLALPPLIDIVPGEPTLGLPVISWFCTTRYNKASLQQGIFKSVANSWFWSPPWWSLHQLDHFLELLGADVDLLLWSKGQHVLWLNAKGRLALWASVFEMSTST